MGQRRSTAVLKIRESTETILQENFTLLISFSALLSTSTSKSFFVILLLDYTFFFFPSGNTSTFFSALNHFLTYLTQWFLFTLVLHLHKFIQGALSTSYILELSMYMGCRACTVLYSLMILYFYGQKTGKLCILGGST